MRTSRNDASLRENARPGAAPSGRARAARGEGARGRGLANTGNAASGSPAAHSQRKKTPRLRSSECAYRRYGRRAGSSRPAKELVARSLLPLLRSWSGPCGQRSGTRIVATREAPGEAIGSGWTKPVGVLVMTDPGWTSPGNEPGVTLRLKSNSNARKLFASHSIHWGAKVVACGSGPGDRDARRS